MELQKTNDKRSKLRKFEEIENEIIIFNGAIKYLKDHRDAIVLAEEEVLNKILIIMRSDYDTEFKRKDDYQSLQDRSDPFR